MKLIFLILFFNILIFFNANSSDHYIYCSRINNIDMVASWVPDGNGNWIKASGNWEKLSNLYSFKIDKSISELKNECSKVFPKDSPDNIYVTIKDSNLSTQYSITEKNSPKPLSQSAMKKLHFKDILDYRFLLGLAYASHYAYRSENGSEKKDYNLNSYNFNTIYEKTGFEFIKETNLKSKETSVHSVAFVNKSQKIVAIAYKGTSNSIDFNIDSQLFAANLITLSLFGNAVKEAIENFDKTMEIVNNNYKGYQVVLTGHSLGAFYASIVSVNRGGIPARVFSSPATYFYTTRMSQVFNLFSHFPFDNVINFVRYSDPVNAFSGRHAENRIYFAQSKNIDLLKNHSLILIINEIFEKREAPYYLDIKPTYFYYVENKGTYFGVKKLFNYYGYTSPEILTNLREKYLHLNESDFNLRESDGFVTIDIPNQSVIFRKKAQVCEVPQ